MKRAEEYKLQRRVAGYHDIRMDGLTDLVTRAPGKSVLDIGCNRGLVGFEFANNGATLVHGVDNFDVGVETARELFIDLRNCESQFEAIDLSAPDAIEMLRKFGGVKYDIVVMLATYHKLKRIMRPQELTKLMLWFAAHTTSFFAWRGPSDKPSEAGEEMTRLDADFKLAGMSRVHTSEISQTLGLAAIWGRK